MSASTSRQRSYNATGGGYESGRYGDPHMDAYRSLRNHTLDTLLRSTFGSAPLKILEVGCGTGLSLEFLARGEQPHRLFGMDFSETMLAQAAQKARGLQNRPKLALGDATRLPYRDGFFDVLYATRFIHQFAHAQKRQIWAEFRRVVRGDGLIIVEFYARPYHWVRYWFGANKGKSRESYFLHYPSKAEVRDVVGQPFEVHPLRLLGSKILSRSLSEEQMRKATQIGGRTLGGVLLDEYFVAARK